MDSTLLVGLSQQLASYRAMDVIANNLANLSTPAFKREAVKFEEFITQVPASETDATPTNVSFVKDTGIVRDLNEGRLETTSAPFDLAITGKGFFAVQTANGIRYTRDGHCSLDDQGRLVNSAGDPIMGDGGAITISPDDGDIHIAADGTLSGKSGQLGKLRVVDFADERSLTKVGGNLYATNQQPSSSDHYSIAQGMLETSNVEPVIEISHMIEVMRAYQATANLTQAHEDMLRQAIEKLGSVPN